MDRVDLSGTTSRKEVRGMRNDLLIRYSSAIKDNLYRLDLELNKDHYNNLVSEKSPLEGLSSTELDFLIMKLLEANDQIDKILQELQKELDLRK